MLSSSLKLIAMSSAFTVIPVPAPTFNVASPEVAVPVRPAPAFTPVISPTLPVIVSVLAASSYVNPIPYPAVSVEFNISSIASFTAEPCTIPELLITSVEPIVRPFLIMKFLLEIKLFLHQLTTMRVLLMLNYMLD